MVNVEVNYFRPSQLHHDLHVSVDHRLLVLKIHCRGFWGRDERRELVLFLNELCIVFILHQLELVRRESVLVEPILREGHHTVLILLLVSVDRH